MPLVWLFQKHVQHVTHVNTLNRSLMMLVLDFRWLLSWLLHKWRRKLYVANLSLKKTFRLRRHPAPDDDDDRNIQSRRQSFFQTITVVKTTLPNCLLASNRLYVSENGLVERLLKLVTDILLTSSVIPWKSDAPKGVYKNVNETLTVTVYRYCGWSDHTSSVLCSNPSWPVAPAV